MRYIKQFEKHKASKRLQEIINEAVLQVDDIAKVRAVADIPQSLINAVVKKCKDVSGKNVRQFYSDNDIAEELVKHVFNTYLNIDHISTVPFVGGSDKAQVQPQAQPQAQAQPQIQAESQPIDQPQVQADAQAQSQAQSQAQPQAQPQAQAQPQEDPQAQPQAQIDVQSDSDGFEEVQSDEDDEDDEDIEELPI